MVRDSYTHMNESCHTESHHTESCSRILRLSSCHKYIVRGPSTSFVTHTHGSWLRWVQQHAHSVAQNLYVYMSHEPCIWATNYIFIYTYGSWLRWVQQHADSVAQNLYVYMSHEPCIWATNYIFIYTYGSCSWLRWVQQHAHSVAQNVYVYMSHEPCIWATNYIFIYTYGSWLRWVQQHADSVAQNLEIASENFQKFHFSTRRTRIPIPRIHHGYRFTTWYGVATVSRID